VIFSVTKQVQEANSNLENTSKNFHTTTLSLCDPMTHASMDVIAVLSKRSAANPPGSRDVTNSIDKASKEPFRDRDRES